tara:strand:+ start:57892 stop:58197 length:306 start_codon:yes stop_codon:yes gene_type:complete
VLDTAKQFKDNSTIYLGEHHMLNNIKQALNEKGFKYKIDQFGFICLSNDDVSVCIANSFITIVDNNLDSVHMEYDNYTIDDNLITLLSEGTFAYSFRMVRA